MARWGSIGLMMGTSDDIPIQGILRINTSNESLIFSLSDDIIHMNNQNLHITDFFTYIF